MEFRVKNFAQLMILSPDVAMIFDDITGGEFNIDSYEIAERPEIAQSNLIEAMNQAFDIAMETESYQSLYINLQNAPNEELFWKLLKEKNELRKHNS